jgi:hypothetical protein
MKKLLIPALGFLSVFGLFAMDITPVLAQQTPGTGAPTSPMINDFDNVNNVSDSTSYAGSGRQAVLTIVNYFLFFLGLIATVMVIYGGFLYITAGGEDTEKAKKVLMYAAIGIIIVLISFALVNTILGSGNTGSGGEL